jgi:hypothetical protein
VVRQSLLAGTSLDSMLEDAMKGKLNNVATTSLASLDWLTLFNELLRAEQESEVFRILDVNGLLRDEMWLPLGGLENNFGIVASQQDDASAALVEKLINGIDANLMIECFTRGIDPEGAAAPTSMSEAVEQFFNVPRGRIGELTQAEQRTLAFRTHLVAVGDAKTPSYLIIDDGEGQTPASFADTFLSLAKSNKLRIPFVQGKFNAGGTGVLQYCGQENLQLIASRRQAAAPRSPSDDTAELWGFTLIRRLRPGDGRRNSMYVYLAPDGKIPTIGAGAIAVKPKIGTTQHAVPYSEPMTHGTVIKLYEYRWPTRSLATRDARYELEKYLHSPSLPIRVTETRAGFNAHYFSTTVAGIWATLESPGDLSDDDTDTARTEPGFPAPASLTLAAVGTLEYSIVVFKEGDSPAQTQRMRRRRPGGVFFLLNGQVHGKLPADFVTRRLNFPYLDRDLFVSIDCTSMEERAREDFFMSSRDRLRQNDTYITVVQALTTDLKQHPGLRELNAARRARIQDRALADEEDVNKTFTELLNNDPALMALFNIGEALPFTVGPTDVEVFHGRRFPTFFRVADDHGGSARDCPLGSFIRIEFVTDASNDYFTRLESPGTWAISPVDVYEFKRMWNGVFVMHFFPPPNARVGDVLPVRLEVGDIDRAARGLDPFVCDFQLRVRAPRLIVVNPSGERHEPRAPKQNGQRKAPRLAIPHVNVVRKEQWASHNPPFGVDESFRVVTNEGGNDFYVNLDARPLISYLRSTKEPEELVVHWFKWGLTLCALGLLRGFERNSVKKASGDDTGEQGSEPDYDVIDIVNRSANGLAEVIIPIIRNLYRGIGVAP